MDNDKTRDVKATAITSILSELLRRNKAMDDEEKVELLRMTMASPDLPTFAHLLPVVFNLNGYPYKLDNHFYFETVFQTHMARQLMLMTGRQVAKCRKISANELLYADNGRPLAYDEVEVGIKVLSVDNKLRWTSGTVVSKHLNPPSRLLKIHTRMGSQLTVTPEHKLRTLYEFTEASKLSVGSRIAAIRNGGLFMNRKIDKCRIITTAYLIGDGCCYTSKSCSLTSNCPEVIEEYCEAVCQINGARPRIRSRAGTTARAAITSSTRCQLAENLREDQLYGKYSYEKRIPGWAFELSREDTALFISRLWATDGTVRLNKRRVNISYATTSFYLSRDIRALLTKFGIVTSVKRKKAGYRDKLDRYKQCKDVYIVRIETEASWKRFLQLFTVPGKPTIKLPVCKSSSNRDTVPIEISTMLRSMAGTSYRNKASITLHSKKLRVKPKYSLSREKLDNYINYFKKVEASNKELDFLDDLSHGDVVWDEIVSIEELAAEPTWDIEVACEHNYIIDGILSHNSTSMAARSIFLATAIPHFSVLFITPLYEQIRRFSTNYVRPFIETSPFRDYWIGTSTENSVLQRSFKNFSKMYFSFALQDADRVRGISAHANSFDEVQDIDQNLIPIIRETMSASPWRLVMYTGTPKSLDNTIETKWQESSQAEWCIPCHNPGCKKLNIPVAGLDLEKMIGPWHDGIGSLNPPVDKNGKPRGHKGVPAVICAACGRWIEPRNGHWVHKDSKKISKFPGYHVPQIIAPLHYEDPERWSELLGKQQGLGNMTTARFYNEVLGVSYDMGSKLITETELKAAAILPWENDPKTPTEALRHKRDYLMTVMGIDWGGGGEEEVSFTCMAVLGLLGNGKIDVIYGRRLLTPHQPLEEAKEILRMVSAFDCRFVAHDYNGAGSMREVFMVQAGLSVNKLIPFVYIRSAMRNYVDHHKSETKHSRDFWTLDKARSLGTTCEALKLQWMRTFKYDKKNEDDRGLLHDFLALIENKVEMPRGPDVYMIQRNPAFPDDFAHAVNYAASAIWHSTNTWPNFAHLAGLQLSLDQYNMVNPDKPWTDDNYLTQP